LREWGAVVVAYAAAADVVVVLVSQCTNS